MQKIKIHFILIGMILWPNLYQRAEAMELQPCQELARTPLGNENGIEIFDSIEIAQQTAFNNALEKINQNEFIALKKLAIKDYEFMWVHLKTTEGVNLIQLLKKMNVNDYKKDHDRKELIIELEKIFKDI